MLRFKGLTLNFKVLSFSLLIGAVGVVLSSVGLWSFDAVQIALTKQKQLNDLAHVQMQIDMLHEALRGDVLTGLSTLDPGSQLSLSALKVHVAEHINDLQSLKGRAALLSTTEIGDNDVASAVKDTQQPLSHYAITASDILDAVESRPASNAHALLPDFLVQFSKLGDQLSKLGGKIQDAAGEQNDKLAEIAKFNCFLMAAVLGFSIVLPAILFVLLRQQVISPLNKLIVIIHKLVDGEVNVDPPGVNRADELGMIAKAMVVFRDHEIKLRAQREEQERVKLLAEDERHQAEAAAIGSERNMVIKAIGGAVEKLAQKDLTYRLKSDLPEAYSTLQSDFNAAIEGFDGVISKLSQSASAINSGLREITTVSDNLKHRAELQAVNLEETAAAVSEISNKFRTSAIDSSHARDVVSAAKNEAAQTVEIVRQAIDAMNSVEASSKQITQIIGVIDEIAFQTNLLALNAGVEAARAGHAGQGFAVVAQDVRELAQRSAEAAKQIKTLLASSHSQFQHGVRLVGDTSTLLERIVKRVIEINSVVTEIAVGAADQAQSLGQVNSVIGNMDKATQKNAVMFEEATSATHKLAGLSAELRHIVSTFAITARSSENVKVVSVEPRLELVAPLYEEKVRTVPDARIRPQAFARTGTDDDWSEF